MKNLRHLLRRVKPTKSRRSSEARSRGPNSHKRRLISELLEQRQLLAADVGTDPLAPVDDYSDVDDYAIAHNYWNQFDVNNDGHVTALDALRVINFMNENPEGEPNGESVNYAGFVDVNADHMVTSLDALQVINKLNMGEGQDTFEVGFELSPRNFDDTLIAQDGTYPTSAGGTGARYVVDQGDIFKLEVDVQDNRGFDAFGVFQAVTDIVVNETGVLEPAVGEIQGFDFDRLIISGRDEPNSTIQFFYENDPSDFVEYDLAPFIGNDRNFSASEDFLTQAVVDLTSDDLQLSEDDIDVSVGTESTTSPLYARVEYNAEDLIGVDIPRLSTRLTIDGVEQTNVITIEENVWKANGEFNANTLVNRYETFMRNHPTQGSANNGQGPKIYGQDRNIGSFDTDVNGTDIFDEVGTLGPVGDLPGFFDGQFSSEVAYDAFSIPVRAVKPVENMGVRLEKVQPRVGFEGVLVYGTAGGKEAVPLNKIGLGDDAEFQLTVNGAQSGITASDHTLPAIEEDTTTPTTVQTNVTDTTAGETITYDISSQGTLGTASIDASGLFSYTPGANQFGSEVIEYSASTPTDGTATGRVTVTINAVNDPPVANDDSGFSVEVGNSILIPVLANDDAGGDNSEPISELTITVTDSGSGAPARGTVAVEGDQVRYTPEPGGASGSDTFTYTITDTGGLSDTATVTLDVINNQVGVSAGDKNITINEDNGGQTTSAALIADLGGSDAGLIVINTGLGFTLENATVDPAKGTASFTGNQIFYTPAQDFNGTAKVVYTAKNDEGSDNGTIAVTVTPVNDIPVAPNLDFSVNERSTLELNVLQPPGGQTPPSDVETPTDNLIVSVAPGFSDPLGTVSVVDNKIVVTSTASAAQGGFSFQYRVTDADGAISSNGVINVNVLDVQDPPVAEDSIESAVDEGSQTLTVDLAALTTIEGSDTVTYSIVSQGAIGDASISGTDLLFSLGANENGTAEVVYRATGTAGADDGTITFTVNPVNDAPTLAPIADQTVQENGFVDIDVLAAADDVDDDALTVEIVTQGSKGTATVNGGLVRYAPGTGNLGADTIEVRVTDPSGEASAIQTINIEITDVVLAPEASPGSLNAVEDGPAVTLDLRPLVNAQAGNVTFTSTQPTGGKGSASVSSSGILTYTPDADSNGQTTLTYTATNELGSDSGTITINITATNDAPIANNDTVEAIKNTPIEIDVLANDTPNPGGETDTITVTVESGDGPSKGTVSINNNVITYTPNTDATGSDSFVYTLSDGQGGTDTATVSISIKDFVPSTIGGQLYLDSITNISDVITEGADPQRSGEYEPGETTLVGVRVQLQPVGGDAASGFTAVTDREGNYSFDNVPPGEYEIRYDLPPGMQVSGEGVDGVIPVTIGPAGGQDVPADFTIESLGTLINVGRNVVSTMPGTEELPETITPGEISSAFFTQDSNDVLVQNAILVGREFGDADYVELLVNQERDEALLVVVNGSNVQSASVPADRFQLNERTGGVEVKVFGGMNDFNFQDVDTVGDITTTYPEYAAAIDELLGSL